MPDFQSTSDVGHLPVLPQQVLELLAPQPGQTIVDCTLGRAGHSLLIANELGSEGAIIGLDVDPENLAFAKDRLKDAPCKVHLIQANFTQVRSVLKENGFDRVNGLLADLGFSSNQMDNPQRGFSFKEDGPLDMRLDPNLLQSAADLVNRLPEAELADIIYRYGEERFSRKIARKIVEERAKSPIKNTLGLARIVRSAVRVRGHARIDPATRTFMALRIAVNRELEALDSLLESLPHVLEPDGRAAIISFHSLEDRAVKHAFVAMDRDGIAERLTRKPLTADLTETGSNPRSRSAKLRGIRLSGSTGQQ